MTSGFADALRNLREAAGLSLDALAERAHCGKSTVGHAENGIRMPSMAIVQSLDAALGAGGILISLAMASHEHRRRVRAGRRFAGRPLEVESTSAEPTTEMDATQSVLLRLRIDGREVRVPLSRRALLGGGLGLLASALAFDEVDATSHGVARGDQQVVVTSRSSVEECVAVMRGQWHELVRADNLLGPRGALVLVRNQVSVVESLLGVARGDSRTEVVALGAKYAESAAWLYEDSGDLAQARLWTSRAIEWAYEADDKVMLAWTMYRRSQQATAEQDGAHAVSLARAGLRHEHELPLHMRAAIRVQQALGYALEGNSKVAHDLLDQAHNWSASDTNGDARSGHGSFCTPSYIEVNRATCLLTLGQPALAVPILEAAIPQIPVVYQRDKAAALSRAARAYAAAGAVEQAAFSAYAALPFARVAGSRRIASEIESVARSLTPHQALPAVRDLLNQVGERSSH